MGAPPSFQFYGADFSLATAGWEADEVGAYMRLLIVQWEQGGLPNVPKTLRKIAGITRGWERVWRQLSEKFRVGEDGLLRNAKLEEVRAAQEAFRLRQVKAGQASAAKRNGRHDPTTVGERLDSGCQPAANQNPTLLSSSSKEEESSLRSDSPSEARVSPRVPVHLVGKEAAPPTKRETARDVKHRSAAEDDALRRSWLALWEATPEEYRVDEKAAKRAFLSASSRKPHGAIVEAWTKHVAIWHEEGTPARFVKRLAAWLDGDCWTDTLAAVRAKARQREVEQPKTHARGTFHAAGTLKPVNVIRPTLPAKKDTAA